MSLPFARCRNSGSPQVILLASLVRPPDLNFRMLDHRKPPRPIAVAIETCCKQAKRRSDTKWDTKTKEYDTGHLAFSGEKG